MMEENKMDTPRPLWEKQPEIPAYMPPAPPVVKKGFSMAMGEWIFGGLVLVFSWILCNGLLCAGANMGFALGALGLLGAIGGYLLARGHKPGAYSGILLILCALILAAFPRSADGLGKFWMVLVLMLIPGLAFCLVAGKNRFDPAGVCSLAEAPRSAVMLGLARLPDTFLGIGTATRSASNKSRSLGAAGLGILIAVPLLAVLIPLLMRADAAFEGLLDSLPDLRIAELIVTAPPTAVLGVYLYTYGAALHHSDVPDRSKKPFRGINRITVNTALLAVAAVYVVYLISQLAYFVGGFSGLLPEEFTMAEYARRGFFEMAWLGAINLTVIGLSMGLSRREQKGGLLTKLLCLFLGAVTLFLVVSASGKMFSYIGSYGLTRLRVLTEVFMLWLAATAIFVCIRLFRNKMPYMKWCVVLGLMLCAGLMWADVDARVAQYNVTAYRAGKLETVDVDHLSWLNDGAVPYLYELTKDEDPKVAKQAAEVLRDWQTGVEDLRGWNSSTARAEKILNQFRLEEINKALGVELPSGSVEVLINVQYSDSKKYALSVQFSKEDAAALEKRLAEDSRFHAGELDKLLQPLIYPDRSEMVSANADSRFWKDGVPVAPKIKNGYWFSELMLQMDDLSCASAHSPKGSMTTIALYDADTNTLYFFRMEK